MEEADYTVIQPSAYARCSLKEKKMDDCSVDRLTASGGSTKDEILLEASPHRMVLCVRAPQHHLHPPRHALGRSDGEMRRYLLAINLQTESAAALGFSHRVHSRAD